MSAKLDQIRWEMEQARVEAGERSKRHDETMARERTRFWASMLVTSLAGVAVIASLLLHLMGRGV